MKKHGNASRRRGMAMIYVIVGMIAMLGFVSLAVDLGRVQTSKTELRRACDAAARAGAAFIPNGLSAVQSEAITLAASNKVNGTALTLNNSNVTMGNVSVNGVQCQAVTITVPAGQIQIPLLFGSIIGMSNCDITATSVAALVASPTPTTQYVSAHGDPWLAGEPSGTTGSVPDTGYVNIQHPWKNDIANPTATAAADTAAGPSGAYTPPTDSSKVASTDYQKGEPYGSPTEFTVAPGSVVGISIPSSDDFMSVNSGFLSSNGSGVDYNADGSDSGSYAIYSDDAANPSLPQGTNSTSGTEHGISNIEAPLNSVIGVFMDQNGATYGADSTQEAGESNAPSTPTGQSFSTQSERDYSAVEPSLNQSFYVGSGQSSAGSQQLIFVPNNAAALFLGTMDGHEWSNNQGGGDLQVTVYQIEIVH
ncbi:MAG TPA: pilus assembly protein TadG-related protein [Tepidisphaeraceae bacterium]|jgi:hypothetical protein|nr:pilus assembly protein TadG-related protein [Tepidisphaeraceae bacterium]